MPALVYHWKIGGSVVFIKLSMLQLHLIGLSYTIHPFNVIGKYIFKTDEKFVCQFWSDVHTHFIQSP